MQSMLVVLGVIVGVIVLLAMFIAGIYNGLVTLRNRYKNAYSQIDVQLKRRYDLIPNLVEAVKGYMAHEKGTLNEVIEARNRAMSAGQQASANPGDPNAMPPQGGQPPMQGNPGVGVDAPQMNPQDILAAQLAGGMGAAGLSNQQPPMPMGGDPMQSGPMPMPQGGAPTGLEDVPIEVLLQLQQQMAAQQQQQPV